MNIEEYKNEYQRSHACDEDGKIPKRYMYVVMYGNKGCDGFLKIKPQEDLNCLMPMELRSRYNSHNDIGVYVFSCEFELTTDDMNYELLQNDKVIRVY